MSPAARGVVRIVRGVPASDGAGVKLNRVIGTPALDHVDPFLLLDEFRSDQPGDYIAGFPEHPHRGFETVTYMLAGRMRHRDNQGNEGLLESGGAQWMTAGRGIVHSEMPEQQDGLMWGFQLWVNLPAHDKMRAPRYQDIAAAAVPEVELGPGVRARVLAGTLGGVTGPVHDVATRPDYFDLALAPGAGTTLPASPGHTAFVYVYAGALEVVAGERRVVAARELALLGEGASLTLQAGAPGARCLFVAGLPLREPVARYGPFVMNTHDEIVQAVHDYQAGRF
ncbi:MAG TPA: pirin family protein [Burkholderiaceae bacterium]|jgi:quercetin 2,3-dioxygenase|nr:pirin family protein [Burkholderiaceae bacterium]